MSNFLIEQENKMVRLVEERGVAAFPYKTAIQQIMNWCQTQTKGMTPGDNKTFQVPQSLTSKIDFIELLKIDVSVTDSENGAYSSGGGNIELTIKDRLVNGKYNEAHITIYANSFYGQIYERTILNSMYHELNHCYEAWRELTSTGTMQLFARGTPKANAVIDCFPVSLYNDIATDICYRLYSETEFNALVAGVFGDLAGLNSTRKNFKDDLHKTQAYQKYNELKDDLIMLVDYLKRNPSLVRPFVILLKGNRIVLNPYYQNENGYIKEFNRKTQFLLKQLLRKIGSAASLYYDSKEVPEDNVKLTLRN